MKSEKTTLVLIVAILAGAAFAPAGMAQVQIQTAASVASDGTGATGTAVPTLTIADFLDAGLSDISGASEVVQAGMALEAAGQSLAQLVSARKFNLDAKGSLGSSYGIGALAESATVPVKAGAGLEGKSGNVSFSAGIEQSLLLPSFSSADSGASTSFSASGTAILWDGYSGGKGNATVRKGEIVVDTKRLVSSTAKKTVKYEISMAYYTAVGNFRLWKLRQETVKTSGGQRKKIEAKFAAGYANKLDVLEAQATELSAVIDEKDAAASYIASKQSLALLCGMDPAVNFEVTPELPEVRARSSAALLLTEGLANRDDLAAFSLDLNTNDIDAKLARSLSAPAIAATGALSLTNNWTNSAASGGSLSLGISIALPVVDAGNAAARTRELETERGLIEAKQKTAVATLRLDIAQKLSAMGVLGEKITLAQRMLDIADGKVLAARARYDEGMSSAYDLMTAIADQASAAVGLEQARISLVKASIELEKTIGKQD